MERNKSISDVNAAGGGPAVLVIIDAQNGFLAGKETAGLDGRIAKAIDRLRPGLIVATKFVNAPGSLYGSALGYHAMRGAPDTDIPEAVRERADLIVEKNGYSAAGEILKHRAPDDAHIMTYAGYRPARMDAVYLAGCDTDACVLATAFGFWDAGIRPVILEDLCASSAGRKAHLDAIGVMERSFGKGSVIRS